MPLSPQSPRKEPGFTYTATGTETDDFFIPHPAERPHKDYAVTGSCSDCTVFLEMSFPDATDTDRTTTHFRVLLNMAPSAGDRFDIQISDRS